MQPATSKLLVLNKKCFLQHILPSLSLSRDRGLRLAGGLALSKFVSFAPVSISVVVRMGPLFEKDTLVTTDVSCE